MRLLLSNGLIWLHESLSRNQFMPDLSVGAINVCTLLDCRLGCVDLDDNRNFFDLFACDQKNTSDQTFVLSHLTVHSFLDCFYKTSQFLSRQVFGLFLLQRFIISLDHLLRAHISVFDIVLIFSRIESYWSNKTGQDSFRSICWSWSMLSQVAAIPVRISSNFMRSPNAYPSFSFLD